MKTTFFALLLATVVLTPNTNIEPSYIETECYHETFQEFKQKEELKKLIQETRNRMLKRMKVVNKQKKSRRSKYANYLHKERNKTNRSNSRR